MSYGFSILFKSVNSKAEAFDFALQVVDSVRNNAEERLRNAKYYIPSHQNFLNPENDKADEEWLYSCFTNCFTYWEEYHLLGMFETRLPKETLGLFDDEIYFQNSTDQDYDYKEWEKISSLKEIMEKYLTITKEELFEVFCDWIEEDEEPEKLSQMEEYFRKSYVYKKIFEALDLDTWMDDEKLSNKYIRFNLCAINGSDTFFKLRQLLKIVKAEWKEKMKLE